jgi:UDP-N-acetylmuramate dehydrogenase
MMPYVIIGGGSNLLIPDEGLEALVIKIGMNRWNVSEDVLEADAGCELLELIKKSAGQNLGGWEKLAGIPGTIGGAVRGNAGAFGPEIKDFLVSVRALNTNTFEMREFSNEDCEFGYRMSFFKKNPEWILLTVRMHLTPAVAKESTKLIKETIREREKRHIQNVRAAGSFFMNPVAPEAVREQFEAEKSVPSREGRVPAGWLIEKVGMKGAQCGEAAASEQHPNYLVNLGKATAKDVRTLASDIKARVKDEFDIDLKEEAVIF